MNENDFRHIIGKTIEEARETLASAGKTIRVTMKDGEAAVVTRDFRTDRLNVEIRDGKITGLRGIG